MLLPGSFKVICDVQACDEKIVVKNYMYKYPAGLQFAADMAGWKTKGDEHFCPCCKGVTS